MVSSVANPLCRSILPLLLLLYLVTEPVTSSADFYKYIDESGGVNVTNDVNSVPERYRAGITVVRDSDLQKKSQAREKEARGERLRAEKQRRQNEAAAKTRTSAESSTVAPAAVTEKTGETVERSSSNSSSGWINRQLPFLKISALIVFFLACAVFAGKLISSVVPRTLGIIIKIALFAGVIVYVFNAYADKVSKAFAALKSESEIVQKAVDKRSERIEKQSVEP